MKKQFLFGLILMVGLVFGSLLTGCSSPKNGSPVFSHSLDPKIPRSFSTRIEDALICSRIKSKMISDDLVNASPVDVDVYNGVAYLKGSVKDDSQKRMIADLTRGIEGVVRIENLLVVQRTTP